MPPSFKPTERRNQRIADESGLLIKIIHFYLIHDGLGVIAQGIGDPDAAHLLRSVPVATLRIKQS